MYFLLTDPQIPHRPPGGVHPYIFNAGGPPRQSGRGDKKSYGKDGEGYEEDADVESATARLRDGACSYLLVPPDFDKGALSSSACPYGSALAVVATAHVSRHRNSYICLRRPWLRPWRAMEALWGRRAQARPVKARGVYEDTPQQN